MGSTDPWESTCFYFTLAGPPGGTESAFAVNQRDACALSLLRQINLPSRDKDHHNSEAGEVQTPIVTWKHDNHQHQEDRQK
ncbi:hypothetical protein [Pseudoxanthomonas sp.]|uniref:hypothetical protein n=1 Tax=Pseudoxanthomonas sp. TaxID=1871049 RepID=UPI0025D5502E|nr:hypothetical protein [Pseudoxanthomonas sp.]